MFSSLGNCAQFKEVIIYIKQAKCVAPNKIVGQNFAVTMYTLSFWDEFQELVIRKTLVVIFQTFSKPPLYIALSPHECFRLARVIV